MSYSKSGCIHVLMVEETDAAALVEGALRHDDAAARSLVEHLYPLVARLVRAHRAVRMAQEDLCQMIFIKILQKLPQYSGKAPLEHWVSRIAINTCINEIKAEKARPELRHADLSEEQSALLENMAATTDELPPDLKFAARELVEKLLAALRPAERLVIDLLYLQQRSVADIQKITGWSAPLVKVRAYRARQKMKKQMAFLSGE